MTKLASVAILSASTVAAIQVKIMGGGVSKPPVPTPVYKPLNIQEHPWPTLTSSKAKYYHDFEPINIGLNDQNILVAKVTSDVGEVGEEKQHEFPIIYKDGKYHMTVTYAFTEDDDEDDDAAFWEGELDPIDANQDNANENLHLDLEKLNQENETEDNNGQQQEDEIIAVDGNDTGEDANATENTNEAQPPAPPEDVPLLDLSKTQLAKVDIVFAAETVADTKTFIMTTPAATDFLNNGEELPNEIVWTDVEKVKYEEPVCWRKFMFCEDGAKDISVFGLEVDNDDKPIPRPECTISVQAKDTVEDVIKKIVEAQPTKIEFDKLTLFLQEPEPRRVLNKPGANGVDYQNGKETTCLKEKAMKISDIHMHVGANFLLNIDDDKNFEYLNSDPGEESDDDDEGDDDDALYKNIDYEKMKNSN